MKTYVMGAVSFAAESDAVAVQVANLIGTDLRDADGLEVRVRLDPPGLLLTPSRVAEHGRAVAAVLDGLATVRGWAAADKARRYAERVRAMVAEREAPLAA